MDCALVLKREEDGSPKGARWLTGNLWDFYTRMVKIQDQRKLSESIPRPAVNSSRGGYAQMAWPPILSRRSEVRGQLPGTTAQTHPHYLRF
jgi:hypothetical protein